MNRSTARRLERLDKTHLWHPFTQHSIWRTEPTLIVEKGKGSYLWDIHGRRYLDGVSSLWVNLHGHRHPALDRAMRRQLRRIAHSTFLGLSHSEAILLGKELVSVAPRGLSRVFYSDSGATAVEIALKMAFQYWLEKQPSHTAPRRVEYLALKGSYHGDTLGAVSVGGIGSFHSKFKPLLFRSRFAMAPACYRCPFNRTGAAHRYRLGEKRARAPRPGEARPETGCRWECLGEVEKNLKRHGRRLAAAIVEPVLQGAAGMIVMPPGYMAGFQALCRRYRVLLIADEVATGFGRTGSLFACGQENVRPDFLCLAKALTGGYTPLAATLTTERIFRAFVGPLQAGRTFFHGHSYTAHPLGAAVARASLRLIQDTKLLEKTRHKAHLMRVELRRFEELPHVGSVRQAGLVAGIELVADQKTKKNFPAHRRIGARICKRLLTHGIWLRPLGDVIVIMPPPVISEKDLRRLLRSVFTAIVHETSG